ncbi:MAG TPA: phosphate ABC transporter permease subunit PstC [Thermoleophilaceae bacterium]|nr:phosphate ABC transporter permease subunit PstC [Thermoleophilaceae bacterium]
MEASSPTTAGPPPGLTRQRTRRSVGEQVIKALLALAAVISVLTTTGIVVALIRDTVKFLQEVGVSDYLFGTEWTPLAGGDQQSFGVVPLIYDTLYLTAIGLIVAVPFGLGSAIYLSEYASPRFRRVVKPIIEVLAGVPTIVFGYFALTFVTPLLKDTLGIDVSTFNALSAGLVLGILVLPTIATVADDALTSVPQSLREGAFGLGASRMQVSMRVVFPAALSGVVAGIVLGASRAIGETVIILVAAGQLANLTLDPTEQMQNMAAFIAATSQADVSTQGTEGLTIFAVGATLFLITLVLNAISIRFVRKYRQVYE